MASGVTASGRPGRVLQRLRTGLADFGRYVLSLIRDPFVLVPSLLLALVLVSAATEAWVTLWRTSTSSVSVPLWIAELLTGLVVLVALALYAYAFGDDE